VSLARREDRTGRWVLAMLHRSIGALPSGPGYGLADLATAVHWLGFGKRRRALLANLAVLLPHASPRERGRIARRIMRSYNRMTYEFFRLPQIPPRELIASVEVVGREHLDWALARGRGAIITSVHVGNWELGAVMLAQMGYALSAIAGMAMNRWLSGPVRDTRARLRLHTIPPRECFPKAIHALGRNEIVALLVDGNIFARGVTIDWFGRPTPFPPGAGLLAERARTLVLPTYCERTGLGRFRLTVEPPLDPGSFSTGLGLHQAIATTAERHIRAHLDQWCIFRPLWPNPAPEGFTAPVGEEAQVGA